MVGVTVPGQNAGAAAIAAARQDTPVGRFCGALSSFRDGSPRLPLTQLARLQVQAQAYTAELSTTGPLRHARDPKAESTAAGDSDASERPVGAQLACRSRSLLGRRDGQVQEAEQRNGSSAAQAHFLVRISITGLLRMWCLRFANMLWSRCRHLVILVTLKHIMKMCACCKLQEHV